MRIGIHATNREQTPEDVIRRCRDIGAEGVCLGCSTIKESAESGVPDANHLEQVSGKLRDAGLEVAAMPGARYSDAMFFGEAEGRKEKDALYQTLERLAEAGVNSVLFYATPMPPEDETMYQDRLKRVTEFFQDLGEHCDAVGINIASHPWFSRQGLFHGYRTYREMCREIPNKRIGITFCPGGSLAGDDLPQLIDDFQGRIHFAHLRDQIGGWESFEEVFPGEGECEVADLLRKLHATGYDGLICPEHLGDPAPDEDREARAVKFIRTVLDGAES